MLRVLIHASREARSAANWYNRKVPGLGDAFLEEFHDSLHKIEENPERFSFLETAPPKKGYRRLLMRRFPYLIVFRIRPHETLVVAVAHTSRRPNYWLRRDRQS